MKIIITFLLLNVMTFAQNEIDKVYSDGTQCNCDSIYIEYHSENVVAIERPYAQGLLEGIEKQYYKTGEILKETPYVGGIRRGLETQYDIDGEVIETTTWHPLIQNMEKAEGTFTRVLIGCMAFIVVATTSIVYKVNLN